MNVEILSTELLRPSSPTPNHLKSIKRSLFDQIAPPVYIPVYLFYINTAGNDMRVPKIRAHLKKSLSETLTRFYPFAGRLTDIFSSTIDCNDEGVTYTEARVHCRLSEFLVKPNLNLLHQFVPCKPCEVHTQIATLPLLGVQVNSFECGGIAIGSCFSHTIGDATTMATFLNSWANTASGWTTKMVHPDFTTASTLFPPKDQLPDEMAYPSLTGRGESLTVRRYVFEAKSLARLKAMAATETNPNPTRVQALTTFIWERYMTLSKVLAECKVSGIVHAVNIRRRADPPMPDHVVGNLIFNPIVLHDPVKSGDRERSQLLPVLAERVKLAFEGVDSRVIGNLQGDQGFEMLKNGMKDKGSNFEKVMDNGCIFTSWCNLGFYEVDFGWAKPIWVACGKEVEGPNVISVCGAAFLECGPGFNGGLEAWISFPQQQMAFLEDDPEFLGFASLNPSILHV